MPNGKNSESQKIEEKKEFKPEVQLKIIDTYFEIREYKKAIGNLLDLQSFFEKSSKGSKEKILFYIKSIIKNVNTLIDQDISQELLVSDISTESLMLFNLACLYSLHKEKTRATRVLKKAIAMNPLIKDMASEEKILRNIF